MRNWYGVHGAEFITVFTVGPMDCILSQLNISILSTRYVTLDTLLPLTPVPLSSLSPCSSLRVTDTLSNL